MLQYHHVKLKARKANVFNQYWHGIGAARSHGNRAWSRRNHAKVPGIRSCWKEWKMKPAHAKCQSKQLSGIWSSFMQKKKRGWLPNCVVFSETHCYFSIVLLHSNTVQPAETRVQKTSTETGFLSVCLFLILRVSYPAQTLPNKVPPQHCRYVLASRVVKVQQHSLSPQASSY